MDGSIPDGYEAAVTEGAQVLGRVKAEGAGIAEGADAFAGDRRAVGLGAVLDNPKFVAAANSRIAAMAAGWP